MNRAFIMIWCCLGLSVPADCQTAAPPPIKRERYLVIDPPKPAEPESPIAKAVLEDGQLKKLQVLGTGNRVQVFEWTHLPMSQENYLRLTESVALKSAAQKSGAEWLELARKHCRREDLAGFLEPGMTGDAVIALLGEPAERQGETLIYKDVDPEIDWLITSRIPLPGGSFRSLPRDWRTSAEIPPKRGTLRWAHRTVEGNHDSVLPDDSPPVISPEDLVLLKSTCLEQLKSCPGDDWNRWIQVADGLRKIGWRDPALGPLVASRFLDEDVVVNSAAILLGELNPPDTQKLVAKRLRFVLDGAAKPEVMKDRHLQLSPYGDLNNLLCQVKSKKRLYGFIREGLAHPHPAVRFDAFFWLDHLPVDEITLRAAMNGLADEDHYIRQQAANEFAKRLGTKADLPALQTFLDAEKDPETRDHLRKAIARIEAEP